ncbi:unnamed protein product [Symbiodinium natans]|uniref:Uncharacterized protein n=1 Tax=Symbiodinium natans TaxID=878477 RepID=A0A812NJ52_9DINO|nr:unnamed protein product [Symbiodinium natans]
MSGAAGTGSSAAAPRQALEDAEDGSSYETTSEEGEPPLPAPASGAGTEPRYRDAKVGSDEPFREPRGHPPAMLDVACQTVMSFFETRALKSIWGLRGLAVGCWADVRLEQATSSPSCLELMWDPVLVPNRLGTEARLLSETTCLYLRRF